MKSKSLIIFALFFLSVSFAITACDANTTGDASANRKIKIIATLFPQYDFVKEIAKDKAEITLLLPPGVEAHSYEPSPKDIMDIKKADMLIYTGENMEPWTHKIIEGSQGKSIVVLDASKGIELMDEVGEHHDEHEHGESEHPYKWVGAFELKKGEYKLSFSKVDGKYKQSEIQMVVLAAYKKGKGGIEEAKGKAEGLLKEKAATKKNGETISPGDALYILEFDEKKDVSIFTVKIEKDGTYVFFTQHAPAEFEAGEHFFKNSKGKDIEPSAQEPERSHYHPREKDPHIWLDPVYAQKMVDNIVEGLIKVDSKNENFYKENGEAYKKKLQELDKKFSEAFKKTKYKKIIYGGHFAFGYLAERYGLEHISPYNGFAPDAEPTPQRIAELIKTMKETGLKTIYYEELIDPKVAKVIAEQTGANMVLLHGAHNVSKKELSMGISYIKIMEDNLEKLKQGLGYNE